MVRPRADNYLERQKGILDGAASMFAERGFDGTSIAVIADHCGVSKALLYHYYQSKEAVLFDMLRSHCQLLVEKATAAVSEAELPEDQLHCLIRALMDLYVGSREKHAVLIRDLHCLPADQQGQVRQLERRVLQVLKDVLARLRPDLKPPLITSLAMYLMGALNWTYIWFRPEGQVSARQFADLAASIFLNGVHGDPPGGAPLIRQAD